MIRWPFAHPLQTRGRLPRYYWAVLGLGGVLLIGASVIGARLLAPSAPMASAPADELAMAENTSTGVATSGWQSFLGAIGAIIVVLGLLYGTLVALRSLTQPGSRSRAGANLLRLLTSLRLSRDQALYLVQCGEEELLVGSSPAGLVLLARRSQASSEQRAEFDQLLEAAAEERPL